MTPDTMALGLDERPVGVAFQLRPYQLEARDCVLQEWEQGVLSTLLVMAVGSGKTEVFLAVLDEERKAGRLGRGLILAHREELADQPAERAALHFPGLGRIGIVRAARDECDGRVTSATVQTLANPRRLERLLAAGLVTHLVIDEGHHAAARTYQELADRLRVAYPGLRILGTTATPRGGSGARGLGDMFDSVAFTFTFRKAIAAKVLVPFTANAVELPVSFRDVPSSDGDWQAEEAGEVMQRSDAMAVIVSAWKRFASGRSTIAFTATVNQAAALAATFRNAGVAAEFVYGGTPRQERAAILRRFRDGETTVVVNCAVLTEGVDLPWASCMVEAKPTRSDAAYVQMLGRVLRLHPGKSDALVLDFVPQDAREMYKAADLRETRPEDPRAERPGQATSFAVLADGQEVEGTYEELRLRVLEYLEADPLAWEFDGRFASVSLGPYRTAAVVTKQSELDTRYELLLVEERRATSVGEFASWEEALERTRGMVKAEDRLLSEREVGWRNKPASDKQEQLLRSMGLWKPGMTKGEAARAISHYFARRAVFGR